MKIILTIVIVFVLFGLVTHAGAWPPTDPDWWYDEEVVNDGQYRYDRYADGTMEICIFGWSAFFGEWFLIKVIECRWDQPLSAY